MRKRKVKKRSKVPVILLVFLSMIGLSFFVLIHGVGKKDISFMSSFAGYGININSQINSDNYTYINKTEEDIHCGELVLINSENEYRFQDENILQSVYDLKNNSYKVKDKDVKLRKTVIKHLNDLMKDFESKTHDHSVNVISGYRSKSFQQTLLDQKTAQTGAAEAAAWVSKPGFSEHHSGLALDLGIYSDKGISLAYTGTGRYAWINQNCYKYGFIVRYQRAKKEITKISNEPWHFRYVGIPHSYIIFENNLCYEEYIDYLKSFDFSSKHLLTNVNDTSYEIYYTNQTMIPVPKKGDYTISGNNVDGFIITVTK